MRKLPPQYLIAALIIAAVAAARPAAYPWFCTSGCMRTSGMQSRCALMPRPVTRIPSRFFGSSARKGTLAL